MSALTYEVHDPASPVARWLRSRFPDHKGIQAGFRTAAGSTRVLCPAGVAPQAQGEAIDWWIRFLVDPAPSLELAAVGIVSGRAKFGSLACFDVGVELLDQLGGLDGRREPQPIDPVAVTGRDAEWQARVCYALALLVQPLRAYTIDGSPLMRLDSRAGVSELLRLPGPEQVADLLALRDLADQHLVPALPAGPVASGPTFEGSRDLNGDADLIAGGMLVDIKAAQGGAPRKDGTRAAKLARSDLDQLIGYLLMDYSDSFGIHTVAIYAARFGYLAAWPVRDLLSQLAGQSVELAALREEFRHVLQVDLPSLRRAASGGLSSTS